MTVMGAAPMPSTAPPMVMPTNLRKMALKLEEEHPGRMGLLFSPKGFLLPKTLPYALDNDRFSCWSKNLTWSRYEFNWMIRRAVKVGRPPLWLLVPDVVADAKGTFQEWGKWLPKLEPLGWPLALAVQDGMTVQEVKNMRRPPDVIFVGGTTQWKWRTLRTWCKNFPHVHVGRVNTYGKAWAAHQCGARSSDGTGWWHVKQLRQLRNYLKESSNGNNRQGFHFKELV